jgi:hypothetical protein
MKDQTIMEIVTDIQKDIKEMKKDLKTLMAQQEKR